MSTPFGREIPNKTMSMFFTLEVLIRGLTSAGHLIWMGCHRGHSKKLMLLLLVIMYILYGPTIRMDRPAYISQKVTIMDYHLVLLSTLEPCMRAVGETRLAASQNYVYVIWIGSADGEHAGAILFRSSNDNGATFGDTFNISNGGIASAPQIVADNSNIYVTWYNTTIRSDGSVSDNEILFTKSSDYGAKFNNPIDLSNSPDKFSVQPRIAVSGKNVYIVWFESGNQGSIDVANIFFTKSNDAGNAFDKPVGLTNNPSLPRLGSNSLKILASSFVTGNPTSGKDIYIIWSYPTALTLGKSSSNSLDSLNRNMNQDANATETSIFFTKSADGGGTFTIPVVLSHNLGSSTSPDMAISQSISPLNTTTTTTTSAASSKDSMYRDTSVSGRDSIVISFISQINPTINSNGFFVTKSTDGGDTFQYTY